MGTYVANLAGASSFEKIMKTPSAPSPRNFKIDARALISLGRESIKDHTTALIELVKNSYDADAENVEIEVVRQDDLIRIADDGGGMTSDDINQRWLRIGFSQKRRNKVSKKGRRETGEKGIGRLSSDRLGAVLQLRSKTSTDPSVGVEVKWDDFDVDGADLGSIPISDLSNASPTIAKRPQKTSRKIKKGTEILISSLRQAWSDEDIENLETELSTLVPGKNAKNAFNIWLRVDGKGTFRKMESAFDGQAELIFNGRFNAAGVLSYEVSGRPAKATGKRPLVRSGKVLWEQLVSSNSKSDFDLGPFEVNLSFFLRSSVGLSAGLTLGKLREYLDSEGGVRIYRDEIRVKPYGDPNHPEGDWLGLAKRKISNPAGASRVDFRIATNQLVGTVLVSRDVNPTLTDSSAREGLIHSESFSALKKAVFGCVGLLESIYHQQYVNRKIVADDEADAEFQLKLPIYVSGIRTTLAELSKDLTAATLEPKSASSAELVKDSVGRLEVVVEQFVKAEKEIEELASQNTVYRGLATVGISAAVFGHETESSLAQARLSVAVTKKMLASKLPKLDIAIAEVEKAEKAFGRIELWGQFAIARIKKDKRKRGLVDISRTLSLLVNEIRPLFKASQIELIEKIDSKIEAQAFPMDVESLALNLLTNAFHAASLSKNNRKVSVSMTCSGRGNNKRAKLVVSDSGAGIAPEHLPRIWDPLFSTKVDGKGRSVGTGLGLTIVKSIAREMGASINALSAGSLGGAQIEISLPI